MALDRTEKRDEDGDPQPDGLYFRVEGTWGSGQHLQSPKGDEMSSQAENARNAARGMFLAAAELCKQGFNVTPTSRNMAGADLLITDDRCRYTRTVQVKVTDQTKKVHQSWLIGRNAKRTAYKTHVYIFVILDDKKKPDSPEFYVVPSEFVAQHQKGEASSMPEFRISDAKGFQDKWCQLRSEAEDRTLPIVKSGRMDRDGA